MIKNNKFKLSAPAWNNKFELPNESYSASDIQDYFEYTIKKHEAFGNNAPTQIYVNKIENRITFKIKKVNHLKLLTSETLKILEKYWTKYKLKITMVKIFLFRN